MTTLTTLIMIGLPSLFLVSMIGYVVYKLKDDVDKITDVVIRDKVSMLDTRYNEHKDIF